MAGTYPSSRENDHDHDGGHSRGCPECDLRALDDLKCEAAGIKAQSDYIAGVQKDLDTRHKQFDGARADYRSARDEVAADVRGIRDQLTRIRDQLRCQLSEEVLECLERAWRDVYELLEQCGMPSGCCIDDDCEFDSDCEGASSDELHKRKADFEGRVKAVEDCFDKLIVEPAKLKERVADLKAKVEALAKEVADPKTVDLKQSYAKYQWYWQRLQDIWLGFEHANEYHDCLCQALVCSLKGHKAIAVLAGEIALRDCRDQARKDRCEWLKTHVVEEILALYLKHCPPHRPGKGEEEQPQRYGSA
jgi:hypothetical protein